MQIRFFFLFVFFAFNVYPQSPVPKDYFSSPMEIPLVLSGTFGELRSNHFHSGIDIKTNQQTGLQVHASGPGYISRIKVQQWGFGKALYIQHPNGYVTVYGHLKEFSPEIEAYVKKRQYNKESWAIKLYPKPEELPVHRGQVIAYSGNSGSSGGPHLHFGIRDGSIPMNPMLFGIKAKDSRKPLINGIYVYPEGKNAAINNTTKRQKLRLTSLGNGVFKTEKIKAFGKIGFGISTVDQLDFAPNKDGIYKISTFCNGTNNFNMVFNQFSFAKSRYINRLIDYAYYETYDKRIQKLFVQPNNPLQIYEDVTSKGLLNIKADLSYTYTIKVSDFSGNTSIVRIPIVGEHPEHVQREKIKKTPYLARVKHAFVYEEDIFDVYLPKGALYEDTYLAISYKGETIQIHNDKTPLHENMTVGFDVSHYSAEDRKTLCIARVYPWGKKYYCSTRKEDGRFTTRTRTFGSFTLATDDTPPRVEPINFSDEKWISDNSHLTVKISDDFSGINAYRATVNGKFILMAFNHKTDLLTYDFSDGKTAVGENKLKIIVTDNIGNSTTFEATFYRAH